MFEHDDDDDEDAQELNLEASLNGDIREAFEESTGEEAPARKDPSKASGVPDFEIPDKDDEDTTAAAQAVAPVVAPAIIAAPLSWSKEHKKEFESLPPAIQQIVARRESEKESAFTRAMQSANESQKQAKEIYDAIAPFQQRAVLQGAHLPTVLQRMLAWQEVLDADPITGAAQLLQTLGVDPRQLIQQQQQQPGYSAEYAQLQQKVLQLETQLTEREQRQFQAQYEAVELEIERFATEANEAGEAHRPYFAHVAPLMQPIVERLRAQYPTASGTDILTRAYEDACYADPDVRDILLRQARANDEAQQSAERRDKAKAARKAGSSVSGAPSGSIRETPDNLRDAIEAAWSGQL